MLLALSKLNLIVSKRFFIIACFMFVIIMSWAYLLTGAGMSMGSMTMHEFMTQAQWGPHYALIMFIMWWVMMVAMMLPSALPMVLIFNTLNKKMGTGHTLTVFTFATAYLLVWGGFSVLATAAQWALVQYDLLATMSPVGHKLFSSIILVSGGVFQLTPFKEACLEKCRSPLMFLSENWAKGIKGSFTMGLKHGLFCLGCCWFLMSLLFYGGVMNLLWIIGLTVFVLLEKLIPPGFYFSKITGVLLIGWGAIILIF